MTRLTFEIDKLEFLTETRTTENEQGRFGEKQFVERVKENFAGLKARLATT
jgi:hypothetical protein